MRTNAVLHCRKELAMPRDTEHSQQDFWFPQFQTCSICVFSTKRYYHTHIYGSQLRVMAWPNFNAQASWGFFRSSFRLDCSLVKQSCLSNSLFVGAERAVGQGPSCSESCAAREGSWCSHAATGIFGYEPGKDFYASFSDAYRFSTSAVRFGKGHGPASKGQNYVALGSEPIPSTAGFRGRRVLNPPLDDNGVEVHPQSPMAQAILKQSRALSALVSHMSSNALGPMGDLTSASWATTGVKGFAAREKLQRELSLGTGSFFLKVCLQRRMAPTVSPLSTLEEAKEVSLLAYLERYGGYGQCREPGMVQRSMAHAFDAAARGEMGLVQDHLALGCVTVEQAAQDSNNRQLAWLLRLLNDPPQNLWLARGQTATGARRPFAPLCRQSWATTALAYIKESEILYTKRTEAVTNKSSQQTGQGEQKEHPKAKPKRKPGGGGGKGGQTSASTGEQQ